VTDITRRITLLNPLALALALPTLNPINLSPYLLVINEDIVNIIIARKRNVILNQKLLAIPMNINTVIRKKTAHLLLPLNQNVNIKCVIFTPILKIDY